MNTDYLSSLFSEEAPLFRRQNRFRKYPLRLLYKILPKPVRRNIERKADLAQQQYVAAEWDKLIDAYFGKQTNRFRLQAKQSGLVGEKIIWQYWGQGCEENRLPDIVKLCFRSVERYADGYRIIRLSNRNIGDYLDLPDFVGMKLDAKQFGFAHFSDLLRLALLHVYGGIWLDATVLMTAPLPEEIREAPLFLFARSPCAANQNDWQKFNAGYFSWNNAHQVNVLNSIIAASARHDLIGCCLDLLLLFWQSRQTAPHYFFFQIMFERLVKRPEVRHCLPQTADDTLPHLLQREMKKPFDPAVFEQIKRQSALHKLTYFSKIPPASLYAHLVGQSRLPS